MLKSISILIPTHNRADILARTIESVRELDLPADISVELVVIANACTDNTVDVAQEKIRSLSMPAKVVIESKPGLNVARNRAVVESTGEVCAFIDDDVWLDKGWLRATKDLYETHPASMAAGRVVLWWEAMPRPDWVTDRLASLLSHKDHGSEIRECFGSFDALGANFSFRREVYDSIGAFKGNFDRIGKSLGGCGEVEFTQRALAAGYRLFYSPDILLKHWVAPARVTEEYFSKVSYGTAQSRVMCKPKWDFTGITRTVAGHLYLFILYASMELFWRVVRSRKYAVHNMVMRRCGQGGLRGVWRRITGKQTIDA